MTAHLPGLEPESARIFPGLPLGQADLIVADPPWAWKAYSDKGMSKSAEKHYATMPLAEIMALPVKALAGRDCLLFLWTTCPHMPNALKVLDAWGFKYSTMGVWVKETKHGKLHFGPGHTVRGACEPFLIGRRGAPKHSKAHRNVINGKVREHSRKPESAYAWLESYMPDATRIDLFARQQRQGWLAWGNEIGKFTGGDLFTPQPERDLEQATLFEDAA